MILPGLEAWCSPPEELVMKKLLYYHLGASDKHLRDITSMLRISPEAIDVECVRTMAGRAAPPALSACLRRRVLELRTHPRVLL